MTGFVAEVPQWLNVSRETLAKLEDLCVLVKKWNPAINLVAKSSIQNIWERHLLDSAQVYFVAKRSAGLHWCDFGSGGGFPGLVIAVLAQFEHPEMAVTMVESDKRKSIFLKEAIRALKLPASVICGRIEDIKPLDANIISARALGSLDKLCEYSDRHLSRNGTAIFPKGASVGDEIAHAQKRWVFLVDRIPSQTQKAAEILVLRDLRHA